MKARQVLILIAGLRFSTYACLVDQASIQDHVMGALVDGFRTGVDVSQNRHCFFNCAVSKRDWEREAQAAARPWIATNCARSSLRDWDRFVPMQ